MIPRYRLKTHDELYDSGFALTPSGNYVHCTAETLTKNMIEYAKQFDDNLILVIMNTMIAKCIDCHNYCSEHFTEVSPLTLVKNS